MVTSKEEIRYRVGDLIISKYSEYGEVTGTGIISDVRLDPLYTKPIDSTIVIKWDSTIVIKWNDSRGKIGYGVNEIDGCIRNGNWEYYPVKLDKK
jgi:hypothetical protein